MQIDFSNYKMGKYYWSKNADDSLMIFKVVKNNKWGVELRIVIDKDTISSRLEEGVIVKLSRIDTTEKMSKCFYKITEIDEDAILAKVL